MSNTKVPLGLAEDYQQIRKWLDLAEDEPILQEHRDKLIEWRFPDDWQTPEAGTEVQDPPWWQWTEWYVETETPTILDWILQFQEIRQWWTHDPEFHKLVASKLVVMDWLKEPGRVEIELEKLRQMSPAEHFDHLDRLQAAVDEVSRFLEIDPASRPPLISSIEKSEQAKDRPRLLEDIAQHREKMT